MKIYKPNRELLADIEVDDNSYRHRAIMNEDSLTLYFSSAVYIEIPIGAYCEFEGETYTLKRPQALTMQHSRKFEYTAIMESSQADAKIWKFRNPVDGRLKFPLTAKPKEHLQMFVDNMNRRGDGWSIGECIEGTEKLVNYDHAYCWDALGQMAEVFETEFNIVGKVVSLGKVEFNKENPLQLSYGRGNGFLPGVGRSNYEDTPPVEVLYVQGGDRNIDRSKYGSSELHLPIDGLIMYDGEHFEDEEGFVAAYANTYRVDEQGMSVSRVGRTAVTNAEDSLDCSEIYPKRIGKVSEVIAVDVENHFYDFVDESIPDNLNYEDYLIGDEQMTVIFQSGMLAGREFDVKYTHKSKNGKKGKRFEIVQETIDGEDMPNEVFKPSAGDGDKIEPDTYAVFHCMLPNSYINAHKRETDPKDGAEWDMMRSAVKYLYEHERQNFKFSGIMDGIWAKKNWLNIGGKIVLGGFVMFKDDRFQRDGVLVRITGIKDYINRPHSPELELSNSQVGGSFSTAIKKLESQEVQVEENHNKAIQYTKRRFRDAKETAKMIGEALKDNYSNSINPVSVETMMMLIGDESLQFRFVDINGRPVKHYVRYDENRLTAEEGILEHMTIGINAVSPTHEYRHWNLPEFTSPPLVEHDKKYYLYAQVSTNGDNGVFYISETAVGMRDDEEYYMLLVGILNSEFEGVRSFVQLYGFTEILPGRITTDRIVSSDGSSFLDLLNNAVHIGNEDASMDWNNEERSSLVISNATIKNALKVLGEALISGFYFSDDRIRSAHENDGESSLVLDGKDGVIQVSSPNTGGDSSTEIGTPSVIKIDALEGVVTARNNGGVAYLSANGIYCDNPRSDTLNVASGVNIKSAVTGNVKEIWSDNEIYAGVYGTAEGGGGRGSFGGYFDTLKVNGMCLETSVAGNTTAAMKPVTSPWNTQYIGFMQSGVIAEIYLEQNPNNGRTIWFKNIGKGTIRVRVEPPLNLWRSSSPSSYLDIPEKYEARATYFEISDWWIEGGERVFKTLSGWAVSLY